MPRLISIELYNFGPHKHSILKMPHNESVFLGGINHDAIDKYLEEDIKCPFCNSDMNKSNYGLKCIKCKKSLKTSNGSGKSIIYDAFYWCHYGSTIRGFGKDKIVGAFDDYCYIRTIWIDDNEREIKITRYINHKKHKNNVVIKINKEDSSKTRTISKYGNNAQIIKLLGIDKVAFLHSVIFSKNRKSICEAKPSERINLLSHILGLDIIDNAFKLAKKDRKKYNQELNDLNLKITSMNTKLVEVKKHIDNLQLSIDGMNDRIEAITSETNQKCKKIKNKIVKLKKKKYNFELKLDSILDKISNQENIKQLIIEQEKLCQKFKNKISILESRAGRKLLEYKDARNSLIKCKEKSGTECPTCKQFIAANHTRKLSFDLRKVVVKKQQSKKNVFCRLHKNEKLFKESQLKLNNIKNQYDEKLEKKYYELSSDIKSIENEINILKKNIKDLSNKQEDTIGVIDIMRKKASLNYELEDGNIALKKMKSKYNSVSESFSIAEFWVNGFGNKGLKQFIINSILTTLETRTNDYLSELTNNFISVTWDGDGFSSKRQDKLHLNVQIGSGNKLDYLYCSSGEQANVWLATELAITDLRHVPLDIILVDECFDGLDQNGLMRAISLITNQSTKRNMICISHRDDVEQHFKNRKVVVMKNKESTLQVAA